MVYQSVKGTRDFYPEEMQPRNRLFDLLRQNAVRYGFKEIESPAFENLSLLTAKSGEEIKTQIFVMEKRSTEEIGLRFDMTVPAARMFITKQRELPKPVKWFYIDKQWRYEAPQKGRLREFYQFGVELFGSDKIQADAEVISLAIDNLVLLGLTDKDFVLKINNRELLQGFLESIGIKEIDKTLRVLDKKNKITLKEFKDELSYLEYEQVDLLLEFLSLTSIESITELEVELNEKAKKGMSTLVQLFNLLDSLGKKKFIQFSPETARGLAYYTGTVFEANDREGKFRALLGGGRYDNMIEQFGGEACPATGFAMGDVVLELFLREKKLWDDSLNGVDYFVAPVNNDYISKALEIASKLRKKFSVDVDLMERKLGKQFSYADSLKAKKVVIVGDETKAGKVKIKDMVSGKEDEVKIDSL
jgi:histidyl-tRNA synthetase